MLSLFENEKQLLNLNEKGGNFLNFFIRRKFLRLRVI